jgi:predicted  nucleic acid-binding Zn-ribbon protein|tara:strand:+ start:275 stop:595 length:321 start_codon:yes stop_codon:yes gene_type:complete
MEEFLSYYAEYGAMGVVVALFVYGYIKQGQRADEQAEALEALNIENKGQSQKIDNIEGIILKMLDRWNNSDSTRDRRHEEMVREVNDLSDVMMEVKGSVSRINGKH